jgi:hypothetical protein
MMPVYLITSTPLNHYNHRKRHLIELDSLVASQVLLGRLSLGSLAHQRTGAAKARPVHWANGAQSQLPNTSRREIMKAAWGTQTCQARCPKDLRHLARRATRLRRCHSLHRRNQRRKRRLRSWSSSVALARRSIFPELSAAKELCRKYGFVVPSCVPGSQFC